MPRYVLICTASVFQEGTIIFSLTDLFRVYNTCYSDLCFILRVKSLTFCYKSTKRSTYLVFSAHSCFNELLNKRDKKSLSKEEQRELWPPQEGEEGGVHFSNKNWEGVYNFCLKRFFLGGGRGGGSVLKHYTN